MGKIQRHGRLGKNVLRTLNCVNATFSNYKFDKDSYKIEKVNKFKVRTRILYIFKIDRKVSCAIVNNEKLTKMRCNLSLMGILAYFQVFLFIKDHEYTIA